MAQEKKNVLTYVDGRGNGERVRFVLAGGKIPFEENNLTTKQQRMDLLATGKLIGDQVPCMSIDGLEVTQSWSIIRHLARFHGLEPEGMENISRADQIIECIRDFESMGGLVGYGWREKEESDKSFKSGIEKWFPRLEKVVEGPFVFGERDCYVDYVLLNSLEFAEEVFPGVLGDYPKLKGVREKTRELPQMKEFLASEKRKPQVNEEYKTLVRGVFY